MRALTVLVLVVGGTVGAAHNVYLPEPIVPPVIAPRHEPCPQLPRLCTDLAILGATATTLTYLCPEPAATTVTTTVYITGVPPTTQDPASSTLSVSVSPVVIPPMVNPSASLPPVLSTSQELYERPSSSAEETTLSTIHSTVFLTITSTVHRHRSRISSSSDSGRVDILPIPSSFNHDPMGTTSAVQPTASSNITTAVLTPSPIRQSSLVASTIRTHDLSIASNSSTFSSSKSTALPTFHLGSSTLMTTLETLVSITASAVNGTKFPRPHMPVPLSGFTSELETLESSTSAPTDPEAVVTHHGPATPLPPKKL